MEQRGGVAVLSYSPWIDEGSGGRATVKKTDTIRKAGRRESSTEREPKPTREP
jgi:hypothetical protein